MSHGQGLEAGPAGPGHKLPRLSGYDQRPNAGTGVHRRMPHVSPNNQGLVGSGQGVHKVSLDPDVELVVPRQLPHMSRASEGLPGGGMGVHKSALDPDDVDPARQLPHVGGPAGTGVGYGAGINVRDRRDKLIAWFEVLSIRLRHVRVCCGDFMRVLSEAVTTAHGRTGVILDPPYSKDVGRTMGLYVGDDGNPGDEDEEEEYDEETAVRARKWALERGDDPLLAIVLYGYEGEHDMPNSWTCVAWKAQGGYGNQAHGRGRRNRKRERIWLSPHCDRMDPQLALL